MATVYTVDGDVITEGLQGCTMCDEAILAAEAAADRHGEPVILADDDGEWRVYRQRADGTRRPASRTA